MKHWKLALVALFAVRALTGCASTPKTPEEIAADQALAMKILAMGSVINAMQPPPPQVMTIHCMGCR